MVSLGEGVGVWFGWVVGGGFLWKEIEGKGEGCRESGGGDRQQRIGKSMYTHYAFFKTTP